MFPIRDTIRPGRAPVVTWALIAVNVLVFVYELQLPPDELQELVLLHGVVPARFTHPEWAASVGFPAGGALAFVTTAFLHGGWLHIIGNMWSLWIFGDNVEDRMGRVRFPLFYVACGASGAVAHVLTAPDSIVPVVGASGAIAGVLGAYLFLFPTARVLTVVPVLVFPLFFEIPAFVYLVVWFMLQLASGTMAGLAPESAGGVAYWAHVGGFVAGIVGRFVLVRPRRAERVARGREGWQG